MSETGGPPAPGGAPGPRGPSAERRAVLRAWTIGARLHTLPAAAAPVFVGGGLARWAGRFAPGPFVAALVGALLIQIATNFANDYHDFHRGADTDEREGFLRVTQAGLVRPERVRRWMMQSFGLALLPGLYLAWVAGWPVVAVGLASIAAGMAYTGGPWPLAYHGLGEPFVFVFFGLVAVSVTEYVQTLTFDPSSLVAGCGVGALTTAILVVNNLRDIPTDRLADKHTLAVRLGEEGSRREYALFLLVALAAPVAGVALFGWPAWSLLASGASLLGLAPLRTLRTFGARSELNGALSSTGRVVLVYGLLLGVGLAL
ncbi:MAG: 1,4-dihydroxy-2-naphthoate polyprenyltransferase [Candidatus Palauibacterales bacterium]|nr:1,4-dihydroxy-2-naphthoate polyprenyltransferase [Candidatus Palauibacterales bacterium]MDP2529223.1 1,4-dihydroxy-2-naphthoate polyprenyltransferase [Candidatus Palauibacterales bacterium]MDP2583676.1 1,4-dihydroxy-2-naphthoate polyprenyltransferase [Candidatus Palauibacterales bacterium]